MHLLGHSIAATASSQPFLMAGPGRMADEAHHMAVAQALRRLADRTGALVMFMASLGPLAHPRGPGLDDRLRMLEQLRADTGLPLLIDMQHPAQAGAIAQVADMIQIMAHPAGRPGLIAAAAASGRPVNLRKAHTLTLAGMVQMVDQARAAARAAGREDAVFTVCERGTLAASGDVVVDMRNLIALRKTGCPVVFDATSGGHGPGSASSADHAAPGPWPWVAPLARAAVAVGVAGLSLAIMPDPSRSDPVLSCGHQGVPLTHLPDLAEVLLRLADGAALAAAPAHEPLFAWHRRRPAMVD